MYYRIFKRIRAIVLIMGFLFVSEQAFAQFTITDNFKGSSVQDVVIGDDAKFTSGDEDPVNAGWLRLTDDGSNRKGYAYVNKSFPSTLGVLIDFEYIQWRTRADNRYKGADGISVFLFDAQYGPGNFQLGAYGGSLGYANKSNPTVPGVTGGYVGIGLDAYGNFARNSEDKNGGPGSLSPNSIVFRGPTTSNRNTTNPYLKGVTILQNGSIVDAMNSQGNAQHDIVDYNTVTSTRPTKQQFYRRVQVEILATGTGLYDISVRWAREFGDEFTELMTYRTADVPPELLKVGFAASTGGGYNNHEIRNILITTPGNVRVVKRVDKDILRSVPAGTAANEITYNIEVVNDTDAALDQIDFSDHLTDANGDPIADGAFSIESITHSGFIAQGTTLPNPTAVNPITTGAFTGELHLPANATGIITVKGKLNSIPPGNFLNNIASAFPTTIIDEDLLNNTSRVETPVVSEKADLIIASELDQSCLDPNNGNKFNLTVSNVGNLDLTYGRSSEGNRLSVTTTLPAGVTLTSSSHSGWSRTNTGQTYTFTRNSRGTLRSGRSLAPISYTLSSNSGYTNTVEVASTAEPIENQNNNSASSTVDATPNPPTIPNSPIYYCLGAIADPLEATANSNHNLSWYLNPGGASSSIPFTPSTSTAGTTTFYVSQKGPGGCESDLAEIEVIVLPEATAGAITGNQLVCKNTSPEIIGSTAVGTGEGTIAYRWESSIDEGTTWNAIAGATNAEYQPGNIQETTAFRRITVATDEITCESTATEAVIITTKNCLMITNPNIRQRMKK